MPAMNKLDLYKEHKQEYVTPKTPVFVDVGEADYLAIQGKGKPGSEIFQTTLGALYAVAFTIKMTKKFAGQRDYRVCSLEGIWDFAKKPRDSDSLPIDLDDWTLMIRTPPWITDDDLAEAVAKLLKKKKPAEVATVTLNQIKEGRCIQMLHFGPFEDAPKTVDLMQQFAREQKVAFTRHYHEIYLSDPRRVPPERLRTIIRIPISS